MKQILVFANPISGLGMGLGMARRLERCFVRLGMRPRVILEKADGAELPPLSDIQAAISIGGDGTLRQVAERLVEETQAAGLGVLPFPMAIVPMGTANLMALHTGNIWRDECLETELPAALCRGKSRLVDVARTQRGVFLIMVGVGVDGSIIHELHRTRTGPISLLAYLWPAMHAWCNYGFPELAVEVDGEPVFPMQSGLVFVGNAREYGTGFPLLTQARSDDGLLDVLAMPVNNRSHLVRLAMAMMTGEHVREEGVIYVRGKHVAVRSQRPVPVQIDGEVAGFSPVTVDLLPVRVPFIVPGQ
ncbi:MAG: diacylglycerol kinase family protein [Tepidisphaeraceae bacterium]|jgi:diacylglycerol kinase family enzyme